MSVSRNAAAHFQKVGEKNHLTPHQEEEEDDADITSVHASAVGENAAAAPSHPSWSSYPSLDYSSS